MKIGTVASLFGFDTGESIGRRTEGDVLFYQFPLDGLLPREQRLAIEVRNGVTRVYSENTIVAETQFDGREMYLIAAVVRSYPYRVTTYQAFALYNDYGVMEAQKELETAHREANYEHVLSPLCDYVATCNRKLLRLGMAIHSVQGEYQLRSDEE